MNKGGICLLLVCCVVPVDCWTRINNFNSLFFNGGEKTRPERSRDRKYPDEQFYLLQRVNHFDGSDSRIWKQRFFVNDTFRAQSKAPIFLVLGGEAELDPIWAVEGAWIQYAQQHGAVLVLLEHRYYGKSQPVKDLSALNLQFLNSRQVLSDTAKFLNDFRFRNGLVDGKVIVFGASYSGSLAAWFRSKYPYLVDGVVASSSPIVAEMEFMEYYVSVGRTLDTTGTQCRKEIKSATAKMYDWWGQPDKRTLMENIFRLCDKINHDALMDLSVFFYSMAVHIAEVAEYYKDNREFLGIPGTNITIETICDVMTDESRGDNIQRYADVSSLFLDAYGEPCLNLRYSKFVAAMNYTELDNTTYRNGARQWLYQSCSEFGWFQTSWNQRQPFSLWFLFPFNFTTDQCNDLFKGPEGRFIYGWSQVEDKCKETNRYYGGHNLPISNAVFVDHELDPWRNITVVRHLPYSRNTQIIHVKGTAHVADIYPPSDTDPPGLTQARETITQTLAKWLGM